jgi:hypothetical protein
MPKKFPEEFQRDVVAVARRGGATRAEVAADFGISESTLKRWLAQADVDDGIRVGSPLLSRTSWSSSAGGCAVWRWRTRSCVVLPPTSLPRRSQNDVPAGP